MKTQDGSYKQSLPSIIWGFLIYIVSLIPTIVAIGVIIWLIYSMGMWLYQLLNNAPRLIIINNGTATITPTITNVTFITNSTVLFPFFPFFQITGTPLDFIIPITLLWFFFRMSTSRDNF